GLKASSAVRLALFAHRTSKLRPGLQTFWARSCLLSSLCLLIGMSASAQGPALDTAATQKPQSNIPCLEQTVAFSSGSTWTLCAAAAHRYGLIITNANLLESVQREGLIITNPNFQKSRNVPPINILYDGRIEELFVPYHPGAPRLFDIR